MHSRFFDRNEFACKCGCGFDVVDIDVHDALEHVRFTFEKPVIITSGCRCAKHNKSIGGAESSQHILGKAVDFRVKDVHESVVASFLESEYPNKFGIGRYKGRTHLDVRDGKARWDAR
ncbi:D-Ala-D-Ala carboxypeptidase family metallohydrolase [Sulfurimonas sp.]|uniref:D-Ala-D-Ala carboxypeptidase family metallohydrolase n=1 Tax=Sulfurimonas sp. TaxID=2022749 RepID=UPI0025E890A5|nr:D-Ala-D-Ala carboxypeptidase family metallohydrolase [Sulfurimonas sp.]